MLVTRGAASPLAPCAGVSALPQPAGLGAPGSAAPALPGFAVRQSRGHSTERFCSRSCGSLALPAVGLKFTVTFCMDSALNNSERFPTAKTNI